MLNQKNIIPSPESQLLEEILVVHKNKLFAHRTAWFGIETNNIDEIIAAIQSDIFFMPRCHAETNFLYKQIIPYVIYSYDKKLFMMQRKSTASEQRLANKFSLGIGGHINQKDIIKNDIISWASREFQEEVSYHGTQNIQILGILNDDTTDVGQVHLGIILLLHGSSEKISIKSEHKNGVLLSLNECQKLYPNMENWSKICFDFILQNPQLLN